MKKHHIQRLQLQLWQLLQYILQDLVVLCLGQILVSRYGLHSLHLRLDFPMQQGECDRQRLARLQDSQK
jgi:hypothetical protein